MLASCMDAYINTVALVGGGRWGGVIGTTVGRDYHDVTLLYLHINYLVCTEHRQQG